MKAARLAALAVLGLAARPALAQPAPGDTVLHLSASGAVQVAPDQLAAGLVARGASPSAATAQRQVNARMADATRMAQAVPGVDARAAGYSVAAGEDRRRGWVAEQTLALRGSDGPALLDLVGRLQERGMALASLEWQLSPAVRRHAQEEATTAALHELQARAAAVAATLGLHVDHLQDVRLEETFFRAASMKAANLPMPPPPEASAAPEEVTAQASADVLLRP